MVLTAALLICTIPMQIFAAGSVKLTVSSTLFIMQGDTSHVDVTAEGSEGTNYKLILSCPDAGFEISGGTSGILTGKQDHSFSFTVSRKAEPGYHNMVLKAVDAADPNNILAQRTVSVDVTQNRDSFSSAGGPAIEVGYKVQGSESLVGGQVNYLNLTVFNRGNAYIQNAALTIDMPDGITIQSGAASRNLGYFNPGKTSYADYPLIVSSDVKTGSYGIKVTVTGVRTVDGQAVEVSCSEVIYIPVSGKGTGAGDEANPVLMVNGFTTSREVTAGEEFDLTLNFKNSSTKNLKNIKVVVSDQSGSIIPTVSSSMYLQLVNAGQTASQTIKMKALKGTKSENPNLNINMSYEDENGNQFENMDQITLSLKEGTADGSVVTPLLMVTGCSYGGSDVVAGSSFPLTVTLTNTSGKTLRNIKMTVADGSGSIIPVNGSNSVFIANIAAGTSVSKTIQMNCARSFDQPICAMTVTTSYEDLNGGSYSSSDSITVPVVQEVRFVVDDIVSPGIAYIGDAVYLNVNYYNMGNTGLQNLKISVDGVQVDGNASTYVGNLASGRSDYYNFSFYPQEAGLNSGKVIFTFEDASGRENVIEKEFSVTAEEMVWDDPGIDTLPEEQPKAGLPIWAKGLIGVAAVAAVVIFLKKRKKSKAEALELDD